jgi:anti-sigma28 factor (negative regulator of flagellin synthesis)
MTRLPSELRDFLTIWVVGAILGVTKDVDMIFTRQYKRARMQVLVLDPTLIPISVDVVIEDNVYELHFKVEPEEMHHNPTPSKMEDDVDDMDKMDEGDGGNNEQSDLMQEDHGSNPRNKGACHSFTANISDQQGSH